MLFYEPEYKFKGINEGKIKPVNPKGIFNGRTDATAEAPIIWPSDAKGRLIGKDPDAGRD